MKRGDAIRAILEYEGFPPTHDGLLDALNKYAGDSVVPGICVECGATGHECEPDAHDNYCDECGENRVKSLLVLCNLI